MNRGLRFACAGLLVALSAGTAGAQWIADPQIDLLVERSIGHIYNLEFDDADKELSEVIRMRPDHPVGYFFTAMVQWWRILTNYDDESQDEKFYSMLDRVIAMCDRRLKNDDNDVTALFFKGGALGFRGRLRANRGSWFLAANDGTVALPLVQKAHELEPANADVLLGIGIYHYYADVIPTRYPIVKPLMLFFPDGDRAKGLQQLEVAAKSSKYARVEATYFLMQNNFIFEKEYTKALALAQQLTAAYPRNPVFHRYLGRSLVSLGRLGEGNEVFTEIERRFREGRIGYDAYDGREAYYYLGRYEFLADRLETALGHFYMCDELSRKVDKDGPSGFMAMTNLHIGMIYDLQKKRSYALSQYRKVLSMKDYEQAHKQAQQYLKTPYTRP